jgi:hypothetical protein
MLTVLLFVTSLRVTSLVDASPAIGSTTVTLDPIADVYVNSSSPDANYGGVTNLYVANNSEVDYLYVMFNLSSIPSSAHIISAQLMVYLEATGGDIYGSPSDRVGVHYCLDTAWTELGITWNNQPSFATTPTDTWAFTILYYDHQYKAWDIADDVATALPGGILTEVLTFTRKTGEGYAVYQSREGGNPPQLDVEYSLDPVYTVQLESSQDGGVISNLGFATFAGSTFTLPTAIDVVPGSYPVGYNGGFLFVRWETSGGVSVADEETATTEVTITGNGTLRAVGNMKRLEYTYDSGIPTWESGTIGEIAAVRFTPLVAGQLLMARLYIYRVSTYQSNTFTLHVMDEHRDDLLSPIEATPSDEGWFEVDLAAYGIGVDEGVDVYIGMEWMTDYNPVLGGDTWPPSDRSWHWNGTVWQEHYSDYIIRAVIGTVIYHMIEMDDTSFTVVTESNSTVTDIQLRQEAKTLQFNVTGPIGANHSCNVTIPHQLLGGPYVALIDSEDITPIKTSNTTHTTLAFTYTHSSHTIEIIGTTVIPEGHSVSIGVVVLSVLAVITITFRRRTALR